MEAADGDVGQFGSENPTEVSRAPLSGLKWIAATSCYCSLFRQGAVDQVCLKTNPVVSDARYRCWWHAVRQSACGGLCSNILFGESRPRTRVLFHEVARLRQSVPVDRWDQLSVVGSPGRRGYGEGRAMHIDQSSPGVPDGSTSRDVEIRVHGIGDHNNWSSLGSARDLVNGQRREREKKGWAPETALPPELPDHELWLINWSRTSRRHLRWLWYVALPYTLVNVAGYMLPRRWQGDSEPDGRRSSVGTRFQRGAVSFVGLLLTLCTFVWSVALLETIARRIFTLTTSSPWTGRILAIVVGIAMCGGMVARAKKRPDADTGRLNRWFHMAVVTLATVVALFRPAHWSGNGNAFFRGFVTWGPGGASAQQVLRNLGGSKTCQDLKDEGVLVRLLDPVTIVAVASVALAAFCSLTLALGGWRRLCIERSRAKAEGAVSSSSGATGLFGSAIALLAAVLMFNGVASALRLAFDNGLSYLSNHQLLPGAGDRPYADFGGRGVLPSLLPACSDRDDYVIDLIPLLGIAGAVSLGLALFLVNLSKHGAGKHVSLFKLGCPAAPKERAERVHRLVATLPWTLPRACALGLLFFGILVFIEAYFLFPDDHRFLWNVAVVSIQVLSVVTLVLVFALSLFTKLRNVLAMLGDVIGFWPMAWHPLGGVSYREEVVKGIQDRVMTGNSRVVLVGHSQGSVLCAWALWNRDRPLPPRSGLFLVTCGSPLLTLYVVFFPAYFDEAFFRHVEKRADLGWVNFWRNTDPIATPNPFLGDDSNVLIPDPPDDGRLRAHGDYWIAREQTSRIARELSSKASSGSS